jgi:protein O-mannosyl-transferase
MFTANHLKKIIKAPVSLLILAFLLIYTPTYTTPYIMDDSHTIQQNQFVHSLSHILMPWFSAKAYSSSPENYGYRPVTTNFSQAMWAVGDGSVVPFQVAKKFLLILVAWFCFLMWKELRRLGNKEENKNLWWGTAGLGFGFFLLHPVGTQVANYIAASSTLLCALFYVLGLLYYFKYRRLSNLKYLVFASIAYFLAVMSKEEGITLIAIVAVCELFYFRGNKLLKKINPLKPMAVLTGVALFSVYMIVSHFEPTSNIARGTVPRELYFATQWHAYLYYLGTYFWPFQFNFDNLDFQFVQSLWTFSNILFLLLNLLIAGFGILLCYRKNLLGLAIIGFYISILPASSLIPLAEAVNDHRHFIPFLFFGFGMIYLIEKYLPALFKKPLYQKAAVCLLLVFLATATLYRNLDFISNKTLWIDTVLKNPGSPRAKNNLALVYMAAADYDMAKLILGRCIEEAIYYYPCFINMAVTASATGDDASAEEFFRKALGMDRNYISSRMFFADYLIRKGRNSEAKLLLEEADRFASGLNKPVRDRLDLVNKRLTASK